MTPQTEWSAEDCIASNLTAVEAVINARHNGGSWGLILGMITAIRSDLENYLEENDLVTEEGRL